MLDITSYRSLGQPGFLSNVFKVFRDLGISVDVVSTSEVSVSLTLDPYSIWSREIVPQELERLRDELAAFGSVNVKEKEYAILSLVCNARRSSELLARVFCVLNDAGINPTMISQGE